MLVRLKNETDLADSRVQLLAAICAEQIVLQLPEHVQAADQCARDRAGNEEHLRSPNFDRRNRSRHGPKIHGGSFYGDDTRMQHQ